jgi:uncharacterized protein YuzE
MKVQYDQTVDALYIAVTENVLVDRTIEIEPGTLVDVDPRGRLLGVEIIRPGREWPLEQILGRFQVDRADAQLLRELGGARQEGARTFPFAPGVPLAS